MEPVEEFTVTVQHDHSYGHGEGEKEAGDGITEPVAGQANPEPQPPQLEPQLQQQQQPQPSLEVQEVQKISITDSIFQPVALYDNLPEIGIEQKLLNIGNDHTYVCLTRTEEGETGNEAALEEGAGDDNLNSVIAGNRKRTKSGSKGKGVGKSSTKISKKTQRSRSISTGETSDPNPNPLQSGLSDEATTFSTDLQIDPLFADVSSLSLTKPLLYGLFTGSSSAVTVEPSLQTEYVDLMADPQHDLEKADGGTSQDESNKGTVDATPTRRSSRKRKAKVFDDEEDEPVHKTKKGKQPKTAKATATPSKLHNGADTSPDESQEEDKNLAAPKSAKKVNARGKRKPSQKFIEVDTEMIDEPEDVTAFAKSRTTRGKLSKKEESDFDDEEEEEELPTPARGRGRRKITQETGKGKKQPKEEDETEEENIKPAKRGRRAQKQAVATPGRKGKNKIVENDVVQDALSKDSRRSSRRREASESKSLTNCVDDSYESEKEEEEVKKSDIAPPRQKRGRPPKHKTPKKEEVEEEDEEPMPLLEKEEPMHEIENDFANDDDAEPDELKPITPLKPGRPKKGGKGKKYEDSTLNSLGEESEETCSVSSTKWGKEIPQNLLVHIFKYVIKEEGLIPFVCRAAYACSAWHEASCHESLWQEVDLSSNRIKKHKRNLQWLCENRLENTSSLSLAGWEVLTEEDIQMLTHHCPKLESLNLSGCNRLNASAVRLLADRCEHLAHLNLSHAAENAVTSRSLCYLIETRGNVMRGLNVSHTNLVSFDRVLKSIMLPGKPGRTVGNETAAGNRKYGRDNGESKEVSFSCCMDMTHLDLSHCEFSTQVLLFPLEQLQAACPAMHTLRLGMSAFRVKEASQQQQDEPGFTQLQELDISRGVTGAANRFKYVMDDVLKRFLKDSLQLKKLNISGCRHLTPEGISSLVLPELQILNMSLCQAAVGASVETAISHNWRDSLEEIDLSGNPVEIESLINLLYTCPNLRQLNLSGCRGLPWGLRKIHQELDFLQEELRNLKDSAAGNGELNLGPDLGSDDDDTGN